jgi:hypothetical protein
VVLESQAEAEEEHPLEVEESLVAEVVQAQEAVLAEQVALEISLLVEQELLDQATKEPQVAERVSQVTVAQETAQLVEQVDLAEAEAVRQVLALAVKEETELSTSTTKKSHTKHHKNSV